MEDRLVDVVRAQGEDHGHDRLERPRSDPQPCSAESARPVAVRASSRPAPSPNSRIATARARARSPRRRVEPAVDRRRARGGGHGAANERADARRAAASRRRSAVPQRASAETELSASPPSAGRAVARLPAGRAARGPGGAARSTAVVVVESRRCSRCLALRARRLAEPLLARRRARALGASTANCAAGAARRSVCASGARLRAGAMLPGGRPAASPPLFCGPVGASCASDRLLGVVAVLEFTVIGIVAAPPPPAPSVT